jgi:hypothetical protein
MKVYGDYVARPQNMSRRRGLDHSMPITGTRGMAKGEHIRPESQRSGRSISERLKAIFGRSTSGFIL